MPGASKPSRSGWAPCGHPAAFPTSMHMIGDPLIELADSAEEASVDTYAVVYQLGEANAEAVT